MRNAFSGGVLWTRREYGRYEYAGIHDFRFIVLSESEHERETRILVLDGDRVGEVMRFDDFEESRYMSGAYIEFVTYHPVMDDEV